MKEQFTKGNGDFDDANEDADEGCDALSPAVRRLVKQYDLDITAIRGSGPSGRVRVGDVMATLGSRAGSGGPVAAARDAESLVGVDDAEMIAATRAQKISAAAADLQAAADRRHVSAPATTVFECDIARITAHRQRRRDRGVDLTLASYFLAACSAALQTVPEANANEGPVHLLVYGSTDGRATSTAIRNAQELELEALNGALIGTRRSHDESAEAMPFASGQDPLSDSEASAGFDRATFTVHDYGSSGCVFATPIPLAPDHAASLGIGRVRQRIVLRNVNGEDTPRAAALCYLTLTYDPQRLRLERANLYLANVVHSLEHWPDA